ncbi:MAG: phosphotransferase family protein [Novosphingobium sp.]|nr:phosphotransferase family protein [Novosphingobium sp.]
MTETAEATTDPATFSPSDVEPRIFEILEDKKVRRLTGPYSARTNEQARSALERLIAQDGGQVTALNRMSGGASKEQFLFRRRAGDDEEQLVLRLDPLEGIIETCRYREAEILRAMRGTVPVPEVRYFDGDGELLGQPGIVTSFVTGVAKPPEATAAVSGLRTAFSSEWRARLAPQFVDNLVKIHEFDYRNADLPHYSIPDAHPHQPALWQVNWWAKVWQDDAVDAFPILSLVENWLRRNLPECDDPVFLHGDYRTGNYLFDKDSGEITAILDWELAHIGDFHEDIAWNFQPVFGERDNEGIMCYSGLFRREELLEAYEKASGRTIDQKKLLFYDVLNGWKGAIIDLTSCLTSARDGNNHQDILLSWLAGSAHIHLAHISKLIAGAIKDA